MPSNCAVAKCPNTTYFKVIRKELIHHRFPVKNSTVCKYWVHFCKRSDKINIKTATICSDHFHPDEYKRDLEHELLGLPPRKRLKEDARPSIFSSEEKENIPAMSDRDDRCSKRQRRQLVENILRRKLPNK